jgi:cytochrome b
MRSIEKRPAQPEGRILVWDVPVRIFHWLLVFCFTGAYLTAEGERWQLVHVTLGYTMAGLLAFRCVWGCVGSRYARFSNFIRGPSAITGYLRSVLRGKPQHFLGHNPAGGAAIAALLMLGAATTATGWFTLRAATSEQWEEIHEATASLMLALVLVHICAVVISTRIHREHLVAAMIHGKKPGQPGQGLSRSRRSIGILLLLGVAAFWWLQWASS